MRPLNGDGFSALFGAGGERGWVLCLRSGRAVNGDGFAGPLRVHPCTLRARHPVSHAPANPSPPTDRSRSSAARRITDHCAISACTSGRATALEGSVPAFVSRERARQEVERAAYRDVLVAVPRNE